MERVIKPAAQILSVFFFPVTGRPFPEDIVMSDKHEKKEDRKKDKKGPKSKANKKNEKSDVKKIPVVVPSKDFDLETYINRYDGHTKVNRLLFIAERYPEKQGLCYRLATEELKKGRNTSAYRKLFETMGDKLAQAGVQPDFSWADGVDKLTSFESDSLDSEWQNHKTNQNRKKLRARFCSSYSHFFSLHTLRWGTCATLVETSMVPPVTLCALLNTVSPLNIILHCANTQ